MEFRPRGAFGGINVAICVETGVFWCENDVILPLILVFLWDLAFVFNNLLGSFRKKHFFREVLLRQAQRGDMERIADCRSCVSIPNQAYFPGAE